MLGHLVRVHLKPADGVRGSLGCPTEARTAHVRLLRPRRVPCKVTKTGHRGRIGPFGAAGQSDPAADFGHSKPPRCIHTRTEAAQSPCCSSRVCAVDASSAKVMWLRLAMLGRADRSIRSKIIAIVRPLLKSICPSDTTPIDGPLRVVPGTPRPQVWQWLARNGIPRPCH